jgi:intein/homing endonuclease
MSCKIVLINKNLIKALGKKDFKSIEEVQDSYANASDKKFTILNDGLGEFSLEASFLNPALNVVDFTFNEYPSEYFIRFSDVAVVPKTFLEDSTQELAAIEGAVKAVPTVEELQEQPEDKVDEDKLLFDKVKYETYKSSAQSDLETFDTFKDSQGDKGRRILLDEIEQKPGAYKVIMVQDSEQYHHDDTDVDIDGQVGVVVPSSFNFGDNLNNSILKVNGVVYTFLFEGSLNNETNSFFGEDGVSIRNEKSYEIAKTLLARSLFTTSLEEWVALPDEKKKEHTDFADAYYRREQAEQKIARQHVANGGLVEFAITKVSPGSKIVNIYNKSIKQLEYTKVFKRFNIQANGKVQGYFEIENELVEVPVRATFLTQSEISYITNSYDKLDNSESWLKNIEIILGTNYKYKNAFKVSGNKLVFNGEEGNSIIYPRTPEGKEALEKVLDNYKRNITIQQMNLESVDSELKDLYDVQTPNQLMAQYLIPETLFYKYSDGKLSKYPSNRYLNYVEKAKSEVATNEETFDQSYENLIDFINDYFTNNTSGVEIDTVGRPAPEVITNKFSTAELTNTNAVTIGNTIYYLNDNSEPIKLEERLHVITVEWLVKNQKSKEVTQLKDLLKLARKAAKDKYGVNIPNTIKYSLWGEGSLNAKVVSFESLKEFVARGIADKDTYEFLQEVKVEGKTWFDAFTEIINSVLDMLGFDRNVSNVYKEVVKFNIGLTKELNEQSEIVVIDPVENVKETEVDPDVLLVDKLLGLKKPVEKELTKEEQVRAKLQKAFRSKSIKMGLDLNKSADKLDVLNDLDSLFVEALAFAGIGLNEVKSKESLIDVFSGFADYISLMAESATNKTLYNFVLEEDNTFKREVLLAWVKDSKIFKGRVLEELAQEDEIENKENNGRNFDNAQQSLFASADGVIRNFVSTLPEYKNGVKQVSRFGITKLASPGTAMTLISHAVQGSQTVEQMMDRMKTSKYELVKEAIKRLPEGPTYEDVEIEMWIKFFKVFSQSHVPIMKVTQFEDGKYQFVQTTGTNVTKIKDYYQTQFQAQAKDRTKSQFFTVKDGISYINAAFAKEIEARLNDEDWMGVLDLFGFRFSPATIKDAEFKLVLDKFQFERKSIIAVVNANIGKMYNPIEQLSSGSKDFVAREKITAIVQVESKHSDLLSTLSTLNVEGSNVQGISQTNTFLNIVNAINNGIDIYDNQNNIMFQYSQIKKYTDAGKKILPLNYNGFENGNTAKVTTNLNDRDWTIASVITLLTEGTMEVMRTETSASSWAFKIEGVNKWVSNGKTELKSILRDYFNGEATRIKAAKVSEYKNRKYKGADFILFGNVPTTFKNEDGTSKLLKNVAKGEIENLSNDEIWETLDIDAYLAELVKENLEIFKKLNINLDEFKSSLPYNHINEVVQHFTYNSLVYSIEQSLLLYGGLEHWGDLYKRNKGAFSTGSVVPLDSFIWERIGKGKLAPLAGGKEQYEQELNTFIITEAGIKWDTSTPAYVHMREQAIISLKERDSKIGLERDENYDYEAEMDKKFLGDNGNSAYGNMEIGDGQGYTNLDFYRTFMKGVDNWSTKDEELYNYEVAYYKRNIKNLPLSEEETSILKSIPDHSFSVIKGQHFGKVEEYSELGLQVFDKFSLAPLIPSVVHNTKMEPLMEKMLQTNTAYVKFQSATKGAQNTVPGSPMSPVDYFDVNGNPSELFKESTIPQSYTVHIANLKEQILTNSKYKKENIYGSQVRKLLAMDITYVKNGKIHFLNDNLEKAYGKYKDIIQELYDIAENELLEELGIKDKSTYTISDYKALLNMLEKEALEREMPKNILDFININKNSDSLVVPFEISGGKQTLQNMLQGLINKRLIRQKINGPQLIQVSSVGFDSLEGVNGYTNPTDADYAQYGRTGLKYYNVKDGKVQKAQIKIAMSANFKPLLKLTKTGTIAELNLLIKEGKIDSKLLTVIGYRIPTQGLSSIDVLEVAEFLPQSAGNIIIPPAEIVAKSGADFDIDKMSFIFPSFAYDGSLLNSFDQKKLQKLQERIEKLDKEVTTKDETKDFLIKTGLLEEFNSIIEQVKTLSDKKLTGEEQELFYDLTQQLSDYSSLKTSTDKKQLKQMLSMLKLVTSNKGKVLSLTNELIDTISDIALDPINFHHLVTPLSTNLIEPYIQEVLGDLGFEIKTPIEELHTFKSQFNNRKALLAAKQLLGIAATANTFFQLYSKVGMHVNPITKDNPERFNYLLMTEEEQIKLFSEEGYNLSLQYTLDKVFKSELFNQYVNGTVDAAKNPFLGAANFDMDNMGMIMYLTMLGIPAERIVDFINQPVIYKRLQSKTKGESGNTNLKISIELLEKHFGEPITKEFIDSLPDEHPFKNIFVFTKKDITKIDYDKLPKTNNEEYQQRLKEYRTQDYVQNGSTDLQYVLDQLYTISHYEELGNFSSSIFNLQQFLNPDTKTDMTPIDTKSREVLRYAVDPTFIDPKYIDKIVNETEISPFFRVRPVFKNVFAKVFPYQFQNNFIGILLDKKGPYKIESNSEITKYYRLAANDFIEFILKKNTTEIDVSNHLRTFHEKFTQFKLDNPELADTLLLREMNPRQRRKVIATNPDNLEAVNLYPDDFMYLELRKEDENKYKDIYIEDFERISQVDPKFARELAIQGFYQSGFNKSYFTWAELIPADITIALLKDKLPTEPKFSDELIEEFFTEFFKANFNIGKRVTVLGNFIKVTDKGNDRGKYLNKKPVVKTVAPVVKGEQLNLFQSQVKTAESTTTVLNGRTIKLGKSSKTNNSGAAKGADAYWNYESTIIDASNMNWHNQNMLDRAKKGSEKDLVLNLMSDNQQALITDESEYAKVVAIGGKRLGKAAKNPAVINKLGRNWYQVKNSEAIYAIVEDFYTRPDTNKIDKSNVAGGTGWAIAYAAEKIDGIERPIYVYNQSDSKWYKYSYENKIFEDYNSIPTLTNNYAGIGTRQLKENGKQAIRDVYQKTAGTAISNKFTWARTDTNSYEVSSKGDKRFSAFFAQLSDGRYIEDIYQLDIKGNGKAVPKLLTDKQNPTKSSIQKTGNFTRQVSKEQSWKEYKSLWEQYLNENPGLEQDLRQQAAGKVLTDQFAATDVSQARALAELLNERATPVQNTINIYSQLGDKTVSDNIILSNIKTADGKYDRTANIKAAKDNNRVYTMEVDSDVKSFSNPWASFDRKGIIKTATTKEAVENYIDWLTTDKFNNVKPERRAFILETLKSGKLKGRKLQYYAELNQPSHATALDYLINQYNWNTEIQPETQPSSKSQNYTYQDFAEDNKGKTVKVQYEKYKTPFTAVITGKVVEVSSGKDEKGAFKYVGVEVKSSTGKLLTVNPFYEITGDIINVNKLTDDSNLIRDEYFIESVESESQNDNVIEQNEVETFTENTESFDDKQYFINQEGNVTTYAYYKDGDWYVKDGNYLIGNPRMIEDLNSQRNASMKQDVVPVVEVKSTFTYKGKTIDTEFELSPDQKQALEDLIDWYRTSDSPIVLQGSAGVGKTAVIGYLQKYLREPVLYTAPTHAATLQLTFAAFKAGNDELASTIRSSVTEKKFPSGETDILLTKKAADKIGFGKLIVVDESSMVSPDEQRLLRGLSEKGYKILYTGDKMQIPYVDTVNTKSKPVSAVFTNYKNINLEKVHRTKSNELIQLLSKIRESVNQLYKIPDTDVVKFYNKELEFKNKFVEKLKEDPENTTYIAYTNKTVQSVNQAARKLLGRSGSPKVGDILTGYLGYASKQIEKGHLANSVLYSITNIKESGSTRVINFESAKLNDLKKKGIRGLPNVYRTEYYQLSREDSLNFEELTNEDFQKNNEEISKLFKELYDVYNQVQVTKNWDLWARTLRGTSETLADKDLGGTYIYVPSKDKMVLYDSKIHAGIKAKYSFLYIEKGADYGHAITSHKCIDENTKIYTTRGLVKVKDIEIGDLVDTGSGIFKPVLDKIFTGIKKAFKITTNSGYEIVSSEEHKYLNEQLEFTRLKYLNVGDKLPISRNINLPDINTNTKNLSYYMGLLVGDGSYNIRSKSKSRIDLTIGFQDNELHSFLKEFQPKGNIYYRKNKSLSTYVVENKIFRARLENLGLNKVSKLNKQIPSVIFNASLKNKSAFLRGLFDADGSVSDKNLIRFVTTCEHIAKDVQLLLLEFGIISGKSVAKTTHNDAYTITISGTSISKYKQYINFGLTRKRAILENVVQFGKTNVDFIPNSLSIKNQIKSDLIGRFSNVKRGNMPKNLSYRNVQELSKLYEDVPSNIQTLLDTNYFYDTIVKIEQVEDVPMYDLEIQDIHQFKANGFVVHNSQGSTYDNVFVDGGSFKLIQPTEITENGEVINTEKQAIAYVSLSRSAKELHVFEGAEDFEMLENINNISKSIKMNSNPVKLDSKFSPMQMSDKVYKVYNNLLDKYDFEFEPAMEEFRQMDNLTFEEVYVDNLGDSVYLVYESNEVNPSFRIAADRSIESARELIYKDGVFTKRVEKADGTNTNLPNVNIDKQQLKDCKNGL